MSGQSGDEPDRRLIDWIVDRWRRATRTERRLVYLLGIWLGLIALAWIVASLVWRGDLSRSTITIATLVLMALAALLLLGAIGSRTVVTVLAAGVTIGAVGGGALNSDELLPDGPPPEGAVVDCPDGGPEAPLDGIVAETELGYTHLRRDPSLHSRILLRYPAGCEVQFEAYCFGEAKADWRFGTPDPVWFELADGDGYVASADLRTGPPPQNVRTGDCPTGRPPPQRAEITAPAVPALSGPVEIAAAAPDSVIVGFAVHYEDLPGVSSSARWHQIGLDTVTGDGITAHWDTRSVPGQGERRAASVTIAAVSCQGLEFPVHGVGTRTYAIANRLPAAAAERAVPRQPAPVGGAMDVACLNPER